MFEPFQSISASILYRRSGNNGDTDELPVANATTNATKEETVTVPSSNINKSTTKRHKFQALIRLFKGVTKNESDNDSIFDSILECYNHSSITEHQKINNIPKKPHSGHSSSKSVSTTIRAHTTNYYWQKPKTFNSKDRVLRYVEGNTFRQRVKGGILKPRRTIKEYESFQLDTENTR